MSEQVETVSIAPTWEDVVNIGIRILSDPTSSKESRAFFIKEMRRLARGMDEVVAMDGFEEMKRCIEGAMSQMSDGGKALDKAVDLVGVRDG